MLPFEEEKDKNGNKYYYLKVTIIKKTESTNK